MKQKKEISVKFIQNSLLTIIGIDHNDKCVDDVYTDHKNYDF